MFSGFMVNAWEAATIVAVVAGVVGFFTVLRGSAFAAHALPNGAFAGAAGASLIGVNVLVGLGAFALLGALTIGGLGRRARQDVATALAIVLMLGLGALFLSMTTEYAPAIYSLLFGEVLGVSTNELLPTAGIGIVCIAAVVVLYRPLLISSVMPDAAEAHGASEGRTAWTSFFLLVIALATTMAVPVVGALAHLQPPHRPSRLPPGLVHRAEPLVPPWGCPSASRLITVWAAIAHVLHLEPAHRVLRRGHQRLLLCARTGLGWMATKEAGARHRAGLSSGGINKRLPKVIEKLTPGNQCGLSFA
jgi:zinc/manganese transport system permease protein